MENLNVKTVGEQVFLEIKDSVTINNVTELKNILEDMFYYKFIVIDLSDISEIDSAGFILIWFFIENLKKREINFEIRNISDAIRNLSKTYNLELR
ncbi:MAG: STAS domain-containing protein [Thermoplasmata archaeon]